MQKSVRRQIITDRSMTNSWGRVFDFSYERLDDNLFRVGTAVYRKAKWECCLISTDYDPATTTSKVKNLAARINMQVHDSLKISCHLMKPCNWAVLLKSSLERPRLYGPTKLSIPCEFKLGLTPQVRLNSNVSMLRSSEDAAYELATKAGLYDTVAAEAVEG